MTAALRAVSRLDDGLASPTDRSLAAAYDHACQLQAFVPPVFCIHGGGPDCNTCYLDHDDLMRRAEDQ